MESILKHAGVQRSEPSTESRDTALDFPVPDIARLRTWIVNLFFVGQVGAKDFVLVDTGMPLWAGTIDRLAEERFGPGARPRAIVLTHGHFDHIGNVRRLSERWNVPVYAHRLELPYLTGRSDYPPPDPSVGNGMMARTGFLYPRGSIDLGARVEALPEDLTVPHMPGWRWIHTPGHTPGHVSLFRESDRALIAGDAFVTTRQESLRYVLSQQEEMHGPPMYFTQDWNAARDSVRRLAELDPDIALTGHGPVMRGQRLRMALNWLDDYFQEAAVPADGRYVREPAQADESGTFYIPPPVPDPVTKLIIGGSAIAAAALLWKLMTSSRRRS